jgi:hypothetical protein
MCLHLRCFSFEGATVSAACTSETVRTKQEREQKPLWVNRECMPLDLRARTL